MHQVDRWVNNYTAVITTTEDLCVGDEVYIESRELPQSIFAKLLEKIQSVLNIENETAAIHRHYDYLSGTVIDLQQNKFVIEVDNSVSEYYPYGTLYQSTKCIEK